MSAILEISTAVGCPMSCSYCPQKVHVKNYNGERMMSIRTFEACLEKLPKHVGICFAGMVEPWVNPNATLMALLAAKRGHVVSVYTTGYGMNLDDPLLLADLKYKHFTLHLPDDDGIMKIKVTAIYVEIIKRLISLIKGVNAMVIGNLHPLVEEAIGKQPDGSHTLISRAGNIKEMFVPKKNGRLMCSATGPKIDHGVLLPNGNVLLCCMDYGHNHVIGNLLEQSYDELFESDGYNEVMAGLKDDESTILCRTCEIAVKV